MDRHLKLVIFAHARSGSSSLCKILQHHRALKIAEEPFHHRYSVWNPTEKNYVDHVTDITSLEDQLRELFTTYNGIKILQCQLPPDIYTHLLLKPDVRVVFLRRRNLLQAAVSGAIAEQTKVWKVWDLKSDVANAYANLKQLSIHRLRETIKYVHENMRMYEQVVDRRAGSSFVKIWYEDLYTSNVETNRRSIMPVFDMLGLSISASKAIDRLLDPKITKLNSSITYGYVPHVDEIDAELGNDETGWLFEDHESITR